MARISTAFLPASVSQVDGPQKLVRSTKSGASEIVMHCDYRCTQVKLHTGSIPDWQHPLKQAFIRAIVPDKATTAETTSLIDDSFGQVSRALKAEAAGPELFDLLVFLLTWNNDLVDTGRAARSCTRSGCLRHALLIVLSAFLSTRVDSDGERARSGPRCRGCVGGSSEGGRRIVVYIDVYIVPLFIANVPEALLFVACDVESIWRYGHHQDACR